MTRLNWGMIGGGEGSQIGPAHRLGAQADGNFVLAAGALDHDADRGRDYAQRLGVAADRAYGDWRELSSKEVDDLNQIIASSSKTAEVSVDHNKKREFGRKRNQFKRNKRKS